MESDKVQNAPGKNKKLYTGTVVSDKMQKTVVVAVERVYRHSQYGKTVRTMKKYKVHDAESRAKLGDVVTFFEGRPVSKTKYMYLEGVLEHALENT